MIGHRIKARRNELGMTQEELAEKMGYQHKTSISKIENNHSDVSVTDVVRFAEALDTSVKHLMGWDELETEIERQARQLKSISTKLKEFQDLINAYDSADDGIKSAVDKLLDIDEDNRLPLAAHEGHPDMEGQILTEDEMKEKDLKELDDGKV